LGLLEFFPVRAYSTDHAARKPHPNLYRAALNDIALPADEVVFVGDEPSIDLVGARRVGIQTVLRATEPSAKSRRLANHVIERIGQLLDVLNIAPADRASAPHLREPDAVMRTAEHAAVTSSAPS
jgi:putative hydrolase of the HAD superfamily